MSTANIESNLDSQSALPQQSQPEEISGSTQPPTQVSEDNSPTVFSQTDIWCIVGKRGSGKSNITKNLIKMLVQFKCPVLIIDPLNEHREFDKYGVKRAVIEYGEPEQLDKVLDEIYNSGWKGVIVVDEADGFYPNQTKLSKQRKYLIHLGRHRGLGCICITRRLSNLHTDVVSQAHKLVIFRLSAGADKNYLDNAQLSELVPAIWTLQKYHYVFHDHERATDEQGNFIVNVCSPAPKFTG